MTGKKNNSDVIIIGAGASGLMCALEASKRGRSIMVINYTGSSSKKILVFGKSAGIIFHR